ncbi:MAG: type II toxin-antitoxin system VapC family toxin [Thermoanaerobaculaceae bacterium]
MSYLLDTNVISELARPTPEPLVVAWFKAVPDEALFLSVLTLGEIRKGVDLLPPGSRREKLRVWLETELPAWFGARLLPVDAQVADRWGRLLAEAGRPLAAIDSLIAATALCHDLRLVTRNAPDFAFPGLEVIDPWSL